MRHATKLGITGGIGSGKSYVARLLKQHFGIPVYDSDREARRLMTTSASIRQSLTALIGAEAYRADGLLDTAVVARYLFASAEHAQRVNAIVHPAVKDDFLRWAGQTQGLVAFESAILLEAGFRDAVDSLLVVHAPTALRVQRVVQRDGFDEQHVRQRMAQQIDDATRLAAADYLVYNDGRPVLPQLQAIIQKIQNVSYLIQTHHA